MSLPVVGGELKLKPCSAIGEWNDSSDNGLFRGGEWSAMTGSPWLTTDNGVLLVPIIDEGSTARKPWLNGVLNVWFIDSPDGPDVKKAGVP